jgi:hypothetical protein
MQVLDSKDTRSLCGRAKLLFKEVFEGLAGVVGARRHDGGGSNLGWLGIGSGRSVFFNGHAEFVELAIVFGIFGSDPLGDGLRALELGAGIEEAALFTTVKLKLALGTFAVRVKTGGEDCPAIGAAAACDSANHTRGARAELIGTWAALRRLAILPLLSFCAFFRVAVTAVTVLAIHKRLRPDTMPEYNCDCSEFGADAHSSLVCIRSDCYTRPTAQS